jgi:hypothetical protein
VKKEANIIGKSCCSNLFFVLLAVSLFDWSAEIITWLTQSQVSDIYDGLLTS